MPMIRFANYLRSDFKICHRLIAFIHDRKTTTLDVIHTKFDMDHDDLAARNFIYLSDQYIKFADKNGIDIYELTSKGILAYNSRYFLKEYQKQFSHALTTILLVISNIVVAIAAVYALNLTANQSKLEQRLRDAELKIVQLEKKS